ncbi:MAG: choice-of-anchor Q domain-containing protein [Chloroflexia bacterium]
MTIVTLTSDELFFTKSLTIQGSGVGGVTIRRSSAGDTPEFRPFTVVNFTEDPVTVTLQGLTITNGRISGQLAGGGVFGYGVALNLIDSVVTNNSALGNDGGGIYYGNGTLTMTNTTISFNSTGGNGGGLALISGTVEATDTAISNNTADDNGGGVYQSDGTLNLTGSTLRDNSNAGFTGGGGFYLAAGTATLTDTLVSVNLAPSGNGGGIYQKGGTLTLFGSLIFSNTAGADGGSGGGGLYLGGGTATLTNSTFMGNDAANEFGGPVGGGIYNNGSTLALRFVTMTNNLAASGGGLYTAGGSTSIFGSIVADNIATSGDGADCSGTATSLGYNVVGNGAGCPTTGTDLAYTGSFADLLDSSLLDNGGPTQTVALPLNSPAIDRVPSDQCADSNGVDQRDVDRPQGPACDSGAFELNYYTLTTNGDAYQHRAGTVILFVINPVDGFTLAGWTVDGIFRGWDHSMNLTMDDDHTVNLAIVPVKTFSADVPTNHPNYTAITELASRGYIFGYDSTHYGPDDGVQRAQMAVLIARATPNGPGTPTNGTLTPPACTAAGTWDCEDWGTTFTDRGGVPASLWRATGTLQHYNVAFGYTAPDCANQGRAFPCYGPTDPVSYAQTLAFISRAMVAKGFWVAQPNAPLPGGNVPGVLATPLRTFAYYTGGVPTAPTDWNAGASRGWFAEALWSRAG